MKPEHELYAYRRHLRRCPFFGRGGRDARADKCQCPFHVDGDYNGRVRRSLKTKSRQIAERRLAELIRTIDQKRVQQEGAEIGDSRSQTASAQRNLSEAVER